MIKKISNNKLAIAFAVLLIFAALMIFTDIGKSEKTFKTNIVNIDTAKVNKILLYPQSQNHKEVQIWKDKTHWRVKLKSGKEATVPETKVKNILSVLNSIKSTRLAANDDKMWHEFQVDTAGTQVKVFENGKQALDLIVGKFSFQQPRSVSTYVRLADDKNVYAVDGFLTMTFNQGPNSFRNETIVNSTPSDWNKISINYTSGDSSFSIMKKNNKWYADNIKIDSAKSSRYAQTLSHVSSSNYVDQPNEVTPFAVITIETAKGNIIVNAYGDPQSPVIASSENTQSYFDGKKSSLYSRIFVSTNKLK